jgi:ABC-2 type transport system permease protein
MRLPRHVRRLASRRNRLLLAELVRANYRTSDHNAALGVLWSLLSPLATLAVMYLVFKDRFGQGVNGYAVFLLIGIVTVGFFSQVTGQVMPVFVTSKVLFSNSTAPRETVIASSVALFAYKFGIELLFCVSLSLAQGVFAPRFLLLVVPLVIAFVGMSVGVALVLALIYSLLRDVEYVWSLGMRLLLFVTPVFYQLDALPWWAAQATYWLNPLTPFVISFRAALMNETVFSLPTYLHCIALGLVCFAGGYALFFKAEGRAMERA